MNILIVLAGTVDVDLKTVLKKYDIEYIIAVDGGYDKILKQNIKPSIIIGDFDSIKEQNIDIKSVVLPKKKDNTDFEETLKYIDINIKNIYNIYVVGFIGFDRLEHFYNNINLLRPKMYFLNKTQKIYLLNPGIHKISSKNDDIWKYISFFAYENITNLTLEGFEFPLKGKNLNIHDSLCISNEFKDKEGTVNFETGKLLVFLSTN